MGANHRNVVVVGGGTELTDGLAKSLGDDYRVFAAGDIGSLSGHLEHSWQTIISAAAIPALRQKLVELGRLGTPVLAIVSGRQAQDELDETMVDCDAVVTDKVSIPDLTILCKRLCDRATLMVGTRAHNDELNSQLASASQKEGKISRKLERVERELIAASHELERLNRELELMSYKDSLTGMYNHRTFQERLREEVARAQRHERSFSLLYGDIDNFSVVNRSMGYQFGDEALRVIAGVISSMDSSERVRDSDVAARYGGEEVMILLPETDKHGATIKAQRLCDTIAETNFPGIDKITMSFGVVNFPEDGTDAETLLDAADRALTFAKERGRNQVSTVSAPLTSGVIAQPERIRSSHERMAEIVGILRKDRAVTCLLVDLRRLRRVEHELGAAQYAQLFDRAGVVLDEMRGNQLRTNDVICRISNDDAYLCVLSPSRDPDPTRSFDVTLVAERVHRTVNAALARETRELIRDDPRITVGHARVLNNSMIRPERLIARLVDEARSSAALAREREAQHNKSLLQELILTNSLRPVYQPIVDLHELRIFSFEALTRGPKRSSLESPAALFSVADEVDLTFELDRACFRGALRGAVGLESQHKLFVNLLPLSFYDSSFIEHEVHRLLEAADLRPHNIVFEITERLAIENFASFRRALANYTELGFGVAIDDVGTRHSNLETVMALRPHFIKVSDVLVRGIAESRVRREMLRSLRHIADAIDAVIVAEGIETEADLQVLMDLGIRFVQGYFLGRPGPPFPTVSPSVLSLVAELGKERPLITPALAGGLEDNYEETDPGLGDDNRGRIWTPISVPSPSGETSFMRELQIDNE